jgi:hypothetical protein
MYQTAPTLALTLPKFLTPPRSVRELVSGVAGALIKGTTVTIPTPVGPQTFNVGDPAQRAELEAMIRGTRFNVAQPQPGAPPDLARAIEQNIPGGWGTVGLVGLGLVAVLMVMSMRARRA